jgi:hypothetical protein
MREADPAMEVDSKKRSLDQVVKKPRFVAQEIDGGAYGFEDMASKRFKCNYRADEARARLMSPHMDTIDAESIALSYHLRAYITASLCD